MEEFSKSTEVKGEVTYAEAPAPVIVSDALHARIMEIQHAQRNGFAWVDGDAAYGTSSMWLHPETGQIYGGTGAVEAREAYLASLAKKEADAQAAQAAPFVGELALVAS